MPTPRRGMFGAAIRNAPNTLLMQGLQAQLQDQSNAAQWQRVLAGQGAITNVRPSVGERLENATASVVGKRVGKKLFNAVNDVTPVGNVTGADEGARQVYDGLTRRHLGQAALGAGTFALSALPVPKGAKRVVGSLGENLMGRLMRDESGAIRAWHGSPHDFDRFEWSPKTRGTGEGAQAYGDGLYFAENKDVAAQYRDNLGRSLNLKNASFNADGTPNRAGYVAELLDSVGPARIGDIREGLRVLEPKASDRQIAQWLEDGRAKFDAANTGRLYEVNINAEPEDFLDWDAKLSEQTHHVRKLRELEGIETIREQIQPFELGSSSGWSIYRGLSNALGGAPAATDQLKHLGIPGLRFLDQGSRGVANGTRNVVTFDDSLIDILSKY